MNTIVNTEQLNSGMIKLMLLSNGVNITDETLISLSTATDIEENRYYYNISNDEDLCEKYKLPSELLLPDDVESSFYFNSRSPLSIEKIDNEYFIIYGENKLSTISFNKKPKFFDTKLEDGSECSQYASMYGRYILALFLNGACYFVNNKEACKFCSIGPSRKSLGKQNVMAISPNKLNEVMAHVVAHDKDRIKYIMYTAGTYANLDVGIKVQAQLIEAVNKYLPGSSGVTHHLTTMPPRDKKLLHTLVNSGLQSIAYDMELYDENLFKYYCPGKERFFGYENMIHAIADAVDVFGKNNVKVGFVGGLEPLETMIAGMERLAQMGASLAVNIFHPDPKTPVYNFQRPTQQYLIDMVKGQRDIYKKYAVIPVFPDGGRRSSLDSEIYRGFFDNL